LLKLAVASVRLQVVQLARELAAQHKERQAQQLQLEAAARAAAESRRRDEEGAAAAGREAAALRAAAGEQAALAAARRAELAGLHEQLRRLKDDVLAAGDDWEEAAQHRAARADAARDEEDDRSHSPRRSAPTGEGERVDGELPGDAGDDLWQVVDLLSSPRRRRRLPTGPRAASPAGAQEGGGSCGPDAALGSGADQAAGPQTGRRPAGDGGGGGGSTSKGGGASGASKAGGGGPGDGGPGDGGPGGGGMGEVVRLLKERAELLSTGLYSREDDVIRELDGRIAQLAAAG
jgi:hypothetical protein